MAQLGAKFDFNEKTITLLKDLKLEDFELLIRFIGKKQYKKWRILSK